MRKHRCLPHESHFGRQKHRYLPLPERSEGLFRACFGAASALEMAALACPGAASALKKAAQACFDAASALKMAILACSGATSALKKPVRARFSALNALKEAVRARCSRSLLESTALGDCCTCENAAIYRTGATLALKMAARACPGAAGAL